MMDKDLTGKTLERQVADAYRHMGATKVEHDVEIAGNQIDVYVELPAPGQSVLRIAVEVKDYARPVGIEIVNDFAQIVDLLYRRRLIHEGVLVGASGFSKQARNAAAEHGLRLLVPADLEAMTGQAISTSPPVATTAPQFSPTPPAAKPTHWTGPHIDPNNPPYANLRELLRKAFNPNTLRRFCMENSLFNNLQYSFSPNDNIDNMIDELFEFCRTGMLWDELVALVAESQPSIYNRLAAQWNWPQTQPPAQQPADSPTTPGREAVERALRMARRTLAILEEQAAAYTALTIPAHMRIELEEQRAKVAELEAKLQQ